jgi:multiple antibiotic resistance protein
MVTLFTATLVLFLIMDPFGNIATFLSVLEKVNPQRKKMIIFREMGIALAAMLLFGMIGKFLMQVLHVSPITVHITSGIILFLVAIRILFPGIGNFRNQLKNSLGDEEPFVVPLAIPLIAGPSLLATIILYAQLEPSRSVMLTAIMIAWLISCLVLLSASFLQRILTNNGLIACERLMGMVLVLLAIQRFLEGIQLFANSCKF